MGVGVGQLGMHACRCGMCVDVCTCVFVCVHVCACGMCDFV